MGVMNTLEVSSPLTSVMTFTSNGTEKHKSTCECPAWYTNMVADVQTVEINLYKDYYRNGFTYAFKLKAKVTDDYYQALFGGVPIGEGYDRLQNAGQPTDFVVRYGALQMLLDERVQMTDLQYNSLLLECAQAAEVSVRRAMVRVDEDRAKFGGDVGTFFHIASTMTFAADEMKSAGHLRYVWERRTAIMAVKASGTYVPGTRGVWPVDLDRPLPRVEMKQLGRPVGLVGSPL